MLRGSNRCLMQFLRALHQAEVPTKFAVKRFGVIAHYFEPAAFRRAFWSKCADNNVATWLDCAGNLPNVGETSLCCCKKMKYRSVMPEVVRTWFQFDFDDITGQPTHFFRSRTQSLFCDVDCRLRHIENCDVFVSAKYKVVSEC